MLRRILEQRLLRVWYKRESGLSDRLLALALSPLEQLARLYVRKKFRSRIIRSDAEHGALPAVIVIGNITVGGTGKTPVIIALAQALSNAQYKVGIIARGYGANVDASGSPVLLEAQSKPEDVGDEPVMVWRRLNSDESKPCEVPVAVGRDRLAAYELICQKSDLDIVLSDDGLQHYALPRSVEIIVIDGGRAFGNRRLIPAGPLREPVARIRHADLLFVNRGSQSDSPIADEAVTAAGRDGLEAELQSTGVPVHGFHVVSTSLVALSRKSSSLQNIAKNRFNDKPDASEALATVLSEYAVSQIILVSGIANPARFHCEFNAILRKAKVSAESFWREPAVNISVEKISVKNAIFPDHHRYKISDLQAFIGQPDSIVIMTEKDAVKCASLLESLESDGNDCPPVFSLAVEAVFEGEQPIDIWLSEVLRKVPSSTTTTGKVHHVL